MSTLNCLLLMLGCSIYFSPKIKSYKFNNEQWHVHFDDQYSLKCVIVVIMLHELNRRFLCFIC